MSTEIEERLKSIQGKLQQVLKQYQALQKENLQLKKELSRFQQQATESSGQLQALQQQVDVLKLGVNGWSTEEKADLEKRIDVYLKEIDKCIALLNN
jgi:predicted  nucleic acid-binding Zn-ribbon protein